MHKNQGIVYQSKARFKVLIAGRRFGKTIVAIITLLLEALLKPKSYLWYVAPTYRQAKMISWRLLKDIMPKSEINKVNESELSVTLNNGSVIELKGSDNEDALRGAGLDGIVIDEFASIYNNWSVWNEVLRPALTDKKGWGFFIGTPKGKDALYELFIKGQGRDPDWESFTFKTLDNPYIDPKEVEEAKRNTPERYFRQEYEASFEDFVGLIYPEFSRDCIIEPIHVLSYTNRVAAIDPAITGTTGVLKAYVDEDGNIVVYDEYYEVNKRVSEVSEAVKEDGVDWLIDPAAMSKSVQRGSTMYSMVDEYLEHGISAEPANNDVEAGINRVGEYFKSGKLKIFSTCKHLIYELERYHWSEEKITALGVTKPKPYKAMDHLVDSLRYIIMSRTKEAEFKEAPLSPFSPFYEDEMRRRATSEGIYG